MWISYNLLLVLLISLGAKHLTVDAAQLICYNGSFDNYYTYSLNNPEPLLSAPYFRSGVTTMFGTSGINHSIRNGEFLRGLIETCLSKTLNCCILDWEKEASTKGVSTTLGYPFIVANAMIVAKAFAGAIQKLVAAAFDIASALFVGFSLGASLFSLSAKESKKAGIKYHTCHFLDSAGPLFYSLLGISELDPLGIPGPEASDCDFTMTVHGNGGRLGTIFNKTQVDLWPNADSPIQPGCSAAGGGFGYDTPENMCSHNFTFKIYLESENKGSVIARFAENYDQWRTGNGSNKTIQLGFFVDRSASGLCYCTTNASPTYGRGEPGSRP